MQEKVSFHTLLSILIAFSGIIFMFLDSFGNNSINGSISGIISAFGFSIFTIAVFTDESYSNLNFPLDELLLMEILVISILKNFL